MSYLKDLTRDKRIDADRALSRAQRHKDSGDSTALILAMVEMHVARATADLAEAIDGDLRSVTNHATRGSLRS